MSTVVVPGCGLVFTICSMNIPEPVIFFNMESPTTKIFFSSFFDFILLCLFFLIIFQIFSLTRFRIKFFQIFVCLNLFGFSLCFWIRFQHFVTYCYLQSYYLAFKFLHLIKNTLFCFFQ